jgi:hypothetical protein
MIALHRSPQCNIVVLICCFRVLNCGSAPKPNWILNRIYKAMVAPERTSVLARVAKTGEKACDGGGDTPANDTDLGIPAFTPPMEEEEDEEFGEADIGPLYQDVHLPEETRVRTRRCPYPKLKLENRRDDCFLNSLLQIFRFAPAACQFLRGYTGRDKLFESMTGIIKAEGGCASVATLRAQLKPGFFDSRADLRNGHQDPTEFLESYLFQSAPSRPGPVSDEGHFFRLFQFSTRTEFTCRNGACTRVSWIGNPSVGPL